MGVPMRTSINSANSNSNEAVKSVAEGPYQKLAYCLSSLWPDSNQQQRYIKWWLEDYSPISGRLRFAVHVAVGYFAYCHSKSYFNLVTFYEETDDEFFNPRGLFGLIFGNYLIDSEIIRIIMGITKVAWFAAAIGLYTDISSAVTAMGAVFLQGYLMDASGGNRGWYVPTAALVAVAFSKNRRDDPWSVDYQIEKRRKRAKQDDATADGGGDSKESNNDYSFYSIRETGFARKCLLVYIVGFYCASGMAKLYSSGFRWADGNTLLTVLRRAQKRSNGKNIALNLMVAYPKSLGMISAAGALFLEAGAFFAFHKKSRPLFLLGWASMHVMIRQTMGRKYEQNACCYLLLVDWDEVSAFFKRMMMKWRKGKKEQPKELDTTTKSKADSDGAANTTTNGRKEVRPSTTTFVPILPKSKARRAAGIGTCLLAAMVAQAMFQIEWWPFTNVDMYSSYRNGDILYSFPAWHYDDPVAAQKIIKAWGHRQAKGEIAGHIKMHLVVHAEENKKKTKKDKRKKNSNDKKNKRKREDEEEAVVEFQKFKTPKLFGVVRKKQWIKSVMTRVIIDDFRAKRKGKIAYDPKRFPDNPASLFLLQILPSLKRNVKKWEKYDYVILTYKTPEDEGPDPIIASIPLDDKKVKKLKKKIEKLKQKRQKQDKKNQKVSSSSYSYMMTNTVLVLVAHVCLTSVVRARGSLKSHPSTKDTNETK